MRTERAKWLTTTSESGHAVYAQRGSRSELVAITCGLGLDALVRVRSDRATARALGLLTEEAARYEARRVCARDIAASW